MNFWHLSLTFKLGNRQQKYLWYSLINSTFELLNNFMHIRLYVKSREYRYRVRVPIYGMVWYGMVWFKVSDSFTQSFMCNHEMVRECCDCDDWCVIDRKPRRCQEHRGHVMTVTEMMTMMIMTNRFSLWFWIFILTEFDWISSHYRSACWIRLSYTNLIFLLI